MSVEKVITVYYVDFICCLVTLIPDFKNPGIIKSGKLVVNTATKLGCSLSVSTLT